MRREVLAVVALVVGCGSPPRDADVARPATRAGVAAVRLEHAGAVVITKSPAAAARNLQ